VNALVGLLALTAIAMTVSNVFLLARVRRLKDELRRRPRMFDVDQFERAPDRLRDRSPW